MASALGSGPRGRGFKSRLPDSCITLVCGVGYAQNKTHGMNRKAFTLIELLVVIIIIGILAAVAVPMMSNMRKRAVVTEEVMGLGAIRTAMRAYYVEHGNYLGCFPGAAPGATTGYSFFSTSATIPGIKIRTGNDYDTPGTEGLGDLDGTYFSQECYLIFVLSKTSFWILCYVQPDQNLGSKNDASKATEVATIFPHVNAYIYMVENGNITSYQMPGSGYE